MTDNIYNFEMFNGLQKGQSTDLWVWLTWSFLCLQGINVNIQVLCEQQLELSLTVYKITPDKCVCPNATWCWRQATKIMMGTSKLNAPHVYKFLLKYMYVWNCGSNAPPWQNRTADPTSLWRVLYTLLQTSFARSSWNTTARDPMFYMEQYW